LETTNSSFDEEFGVDSLCTPSILVSFKGIF
jgi:acyl carrier protein